MISEFLFFEEDGTKEEKTNYISLKIRMRDLLKDNFNRQVLSEILLDLQRDVSGNTEKKLFTLYQDLGLHANAYKNLKSWRWEIVSKGILELTQMQVFDAYSIITQFINDKRGIIRKQAEIATVTLKNDGINYLLDTTKYQLSEWQQLKLLEVIRSLEDFEPPRFKAWLTSSNKDVVLFALRLIKYYNQNDANTSIIQLVGHKNNQIKEEAINCIKKFNVFDAIGTLKNAFWKSNVSIKILILGAIGEMGKEEDIEFLRVVETRESNFIVISKALSAINFIIPESVMPTQNIENIPVDQVIDHEEAPKNQEKTIDKQNIIDGSRESVVKKEPENEENLLNINVIEETIFDVTPNNVVFNLSEASKSEEETIHKQDVIDNTEKNEVENEPENKEKLLNINVIEEIIFYVPPTNVVPNLSEKTPRNEEETMHRQDIIDNTEKSEVENEPESEENLLDINAKEEIIFDVLPNNVSSNLSVDYINTLEVDFLPFVINEGNELEKEIYTESDTKEISTVNIFNNNFFEQDNYNKITILDTVEYLGGEKEIPFLKEIIEIEDNVDIRERALEILNNFSETTFYLDNENKVVFENEKGTSGLSIFKELFDTSDKETRLVLLDQILEIGGEKELKLLNSLKSHSDSDIKYKVNQIISQLEKKLSSPTEKNERKDLSSINSHLKRNSLLESIDVKLFQSIDYIERESGSIEQIKSKERRKLLPLEFCFLLDELDIEPSKQSDVMDIDFEITEEFLKKPKTNIRKPGNDKY